jgi:large subunit ribosomal protein L7/L12
MADDKKADEVKKEEKQTKADPKLEKIIEDISKLSVLELSELVSAMEETFGVQAMAAAPVAAAGAATGGEEAAAEEKSSFTVVLTDGGANKINTIKALREIKPELGLKEAKDMTEKVPAEILVDAKKEDAEKAKASLEEAGAKVELK